MIYVMSGGGKTFAAIGVIYPEGSELICRNKDKTKILKAKNTSGQWVFNIPKEGEWTIISTQGTNEAKKTIEITAEGQCEKIILAYDLVLFSSEGLANGYSIKNNYITPAVDLSKFSSLEVIYTNKGNVTFGLDDNPAEVSLQNLPILYRNPTDVGTNIIATIDNLIDYQDKKLYFGLWGAYDGYPLYPDAVTLQIENKILNVDYNGMSAAQFGAQITSIKFKN